MIKRNYSRKEFVSFLQEMVKERESGAEWDNNDLTSFLEALSGWIQDMDGYYKNVEGQQPEEPNWKVFADALNAAKIYD